MNLPIIKFQDKVISYYVVRSKRAQKLRLEWRDDLAKCIAPIGVTNRQILNFVHQSAGWLAKQISKPKLKATYLLPPLWPSKMAEGSVVPYMGTQLILTKDLKHGAKIYRQGRFLFYPASMRGNLNEAVVVWLKAQALLYAKHWSKKIYKNFGLKPKTISVRAQKSRWGSCGIHDDIYLNWRLICFSRRVFMYVVVHEHGHLKYRNHSKRFWDLVSKMMPDYKMHDKWLNRFGGHFVG